MPTLVAIPGQPCLGAPLPGGAPELAIAAVKRLSDAILAETFAGFFASEPPMRPIYDAACGRLSVLCTAAMTHSSIYHIAIDWRWARLWETDSWYEVGWHPDGNCFALCNGRARQIWNALNPGKRRPR